MPRAVTSDVLREGLGVLGRAIRAEPRIFAVAVAGSALYAVTTVGSAWVLGRVTEQVVLPAFREGRSGAGALAVAAAAVIGVAVLKVAGIVARRIGGGVMQFRLQATYRHRVTGQYLRLPLAWHQRHPTGRLLSNASADIEAALAPVNPLAMAVGVLLMLVVAGASLVWVDLSLAFVGLAIFPTLAVINVVYQRRLTPIATRAQQLRADVSAVAHESFDGALVVKTLGREADETVRFDRHAGELRDANVAVGRIRGLFDPLMEALPNLGVLAVLVVGTARIEQDAVTPGELVQVAYLFTLLAFPIRALGWVLGELPRSVVGWRRVNDVLTATGALTYGDASVDGAGPARLDVTEATVDYDGTDVLHGVSLTVAAGRTVALVGPTGAGKSTLTNVLVRLVDPRSGAVWIDGVDAREVAHGGLPAALVPQQAFLFDDSVRGNVTLGLDVPDDSVWDALRLAQADGFVAALPYGLDTQVGERGASLSGGQRQRIALARALVRTPRLLVLDDATSSVDPQVEARILDGLRAAALPSTVVVVAYRKATIALADEVVYVEHGRVRDRGAHDELLGRCAGYRDLVTAYERAEAERARARGGTVGAEEGSAV